MLYMLDTDVSSYLIKGRSPEIQTHILNVSPDEICISAITKAELLYGLKRLPDDHRLQLVVRRYLKIVTILPWDVDAAEYYAEIRHQLVSTGQPIGEMDMMIAAHAMSVGATLVTNNLRHYQRIGPLRIEDWTRAE